jgi:hypothetical protein
LFLGAGAARDPIKTLSSAAEIHLRLVRYPEVSLYHKRNVYLDVSNPEFLGSKNSFLQKSILKSGCKVSSAHVADYQPSEAAFALDRDCKTLSRHVLEQLQSFGPEAQDLSALMTRIALAGKLIARHLSRAGLVESALGFTGETNVQGEAVKKMDIYANDVFISVFKQSGLVCRLASEEMEKPYYIPENCPIGRYTLLYDPIDGSSNVDINLNIGSIFSIRRQQGDDLDQNGSDLLQDGHQQLAAGYILYGPSTLLVYSIGRGVHAFTLDPSLGEFILAEENIRCPTTVLPTASTKATSGSGMIPSAILPAMCTATMATLPAIPGHWWPIFTAF